VAIRTAPAAVSSADGTVYCSTRVDLLADGIPDTAALTAVKVCESASSVVVTPPETNDSVAVIVTVPVADALNVSVVPLLVADPGTTTFVVVLVVATAIMVPVPERPSTLKVPPEIVNETSSLTSEPTVIVT
jgi:hypothetical protein